MLNNRKLPSRQDVLPDDNPEAIAKHAICVVEKAIKDRFGLDVHGGMELEYGIFVPVSMDKHDPALALLNSSKRGYLTAAEKEIKKRSLHTVEFSKKSDQNVTLRTDDKGITHKTIDTHTERSYFGAGDTLFPQSPFICYSYDEFGSWHEHNGFWKHHESVISHLARHDTVPMGEGRFVVLARATEALRRTVANPSPSSIISASSKIKTHQEMLHRLNDTIQERVTDAKTPHTNGLHLNLSLSRRVKCTEKNKFKQEPMFMYLVYDSSIRDILKSVMADIWNEAALLMHPSQSSFDRASKRKETHQSNGIFFWDKRIEIKRPPASANPYYVTLVGLLSVYHMLDAAGYNPETNGYEAVKIDIININGEAKDSYSLPDCTIHYDQAIDEATYKDSKALKRIFTKQFFDRAHLIRDTLNSMEPELGSAFEDAIKRTPPGTEKSREAAGIVSYEDILARRNAAAQSQGTSRA